MSVTVSRLLHAGYIFECAGSKIAFDPLFENPFSVNCFAYPAVQFNRDAIRGENFDAVFISHFHDDHFSLESLNLIDRATPIYMYCVFDEILGLARELGFKNLHVLKLNVPVRVGSFEVIPRRALDEDVDSMFQVKAAGLNILNVVDSWIDDESLELLKIQAPWDMILWPFQTMGELEVLSPARAEPPSRHIPPEWRRQLQSLAPRYLVPSSCQFIQEDWSWYRQRYFPISYEQFAVDVADILPATQLVRLNPGCSVNLSRELLKTATPIPWITPVGDQNVDYSYDENSVIQTTDEIAKKFSALSKSETQTVLDYCYDGMAKKYATLDDTDYFQSPKLWELKVYDHLGHATPFYFLVGKNTLEQMPPFKVNPHWRTELPIAKLHGALKRGESLSSMYVRINEGDFDSETSLKLGEADLMEDPLLRCLFNGELGSYQKAQLKRLTK